LTAWLQNNPDGGSKKQYINEKKSVKDQNCWGGKKTGTGPPEHGSWGVGDRRKSLGAIIETRQGVLGDKRWELVKRQRDLLVWDG